MTNSNEEEKIDPKLIAWREFKEQIVFDHCTDESHTGLKIEVMGLSSAEKYDPGEDEVCISIYALYHKNWGGTSRPTGLSSKFVDILYMQFDDKPDLKAYDPRFDTAVEITNAQADQIATFVGKHRHRKKIVVHCYVGASRSRSTAAAIVTALNLPYSFTVANSRVYRMVLQALQKVLSI